MSEETKRVVETYQTPFGEVSINSKFALAISTNGHFLSPEQEISETLYRLTELVFKETGEMPVLEINLK